MQIWIIIKYLVNQIPLKTPISYILKYGKNSRIESTKLVKTPKLITLYINKYIILNVNKM